jgi:signal transduction histidine kinase
MLTCPTEVAPNRRVRQAVPVPKGEQRATAPLQRALVQVAVISLLGVVGTAALLEAGPLGDVILVHGYPLLAALYTGAGLVAWSRRPDNGLGPLLTLAGTAWLLAGLQNTGVPVVIAAGLVVSSVPIAMVVHLLHAYPSGRLEGAASTWTVVTAYATAIVLQVPQWAFLPSGPPFDLLTISARPDLAQAGYRAQVALGAVVVLVTVVVLLRRLRDFSTGHRRVLAPLLAYGCLAVMTPALSANFLRPVVGLYPGFTVELVVLAGVPVLFLVAVLRGGFRATGRLSELVTSAASSSAPRELERALATTLGDPSVALLPWSSDRAAYVDAGGAVAELPESGTTRAVVHVSVADRAVGAVVYDPVLNPDPAPVVAAGRVAAIALDRDHLLDEVAASRSALLEASARVLDSGDRERRRIARDLHDGLQVSLVRLSMQAHQLSQDPVDGGTQGLAVRMAADVDAAAAALRSFVDGVMPAPLVERGLEAAVQELAYGLPVRITVRATDVAHPLPPPVESTAYFVVAEALTNVVKHSGATRVEVELVQQVDELRIEVSDDGAGQVASASVSTGARAGSGLAGLQDRIDLLGGSLAVSSGATGTRLSAVLPCGW